MLLGAPSLRNDVRRPLISAVLGHVVIERAAAGDVWASATLDVFQLMNRRYEHASTVLTSNKVFEEWGTVLGDEVMAAALIDRVLHHCHLVNIRGNSFRTREHTARREALTEDLDVEVSRSGRSRAKAGN
jgi:hypothetical protein